MKSLLSLFAIVLVGVNSQADQPIVVRGIPLDKIVCRVKVAIQVPDGTGSFGGKNTKEVVTYSENAPRDVRTVNVAQFANQCLAHAYQIKNNLSPLTNSNYLAFRKVACGGQNTTGAYSGTVTTVQYNAKYDSGYEKLPIYYRYFNQIPGPYGIGKDPYFSGFCNGVDPVQGKTCVLGKCQKYTIQYSNF